MNQVFQKRRYLAWHTTLDVLQPITKVISLTLHVAMRLVTIYWKSFDVKEGGGGGETNFEFKMQTRKVITVCKIVPIKYVYEYYHIYMKKLFKKQAGI